MSANYIIKEAAMTEREKKGFEKLVEDVEIKLEEKIQKKEISEIREFKKEHLYNGTKRRKHILPAGKQAAAR